MKLVKSTIIVALAALLFSCTVDSYTGSVTVYNKSDKDCALVKVGSLNFGKMRKGEIKTLYFKIAEKNIQVSADGFSPVSQKEGKINLVFNTIYTMELSKDYGEYSFNISGESADEETAGYMY